MPLYLDDVREAPAGWDCVRSYDEFVAYLETNGMPDYISFDHDLGFEHMKFYHQHLAPGCDQAPIPYETFHMKTGYDCAKYIVDNGLPLPKVGWGCHSMNPVGKQNIEALLTSYAKHLYADPSGK